MDHESTASNSADSAKTSPPSCRPRRRSREHGDDDGSDEEHHRLLRVDRGREEQARADQARARRIRAGDERGADHGERGCERVYARKVVIPFKARVGARCEGRTHRAEHQPSRASAHVRAELSAEHEHQHDERERREGARWPIVDAEDTPDQCEQSRMAGRIWIRHEAVDAVHVERLPMQQPIGLIHLTALEPIDVYRQARARGHGVRDHRELRRRRERRPGDSDPDQDARRRHVGQDYQVKRAR